MVFGLRRRLLVLLIAPLLMLAMLNAWFEYRSADSVAALQDQHLLSLLPLLADSLVTGDSGAPVLLLPPALEQFLDVRRATTAYAISDSDGQVLYGQAWLASSPLAVHGPEFHSEESRGVTWRIVRQRHSTIFGDLVMTLADASDPRQQWARAILAKVLLPHLVMIGAAALAVRWAVARALKPLLQLAEVVSRRSPQDLSAIEQDSSPDEVRPLVAALNRLLELVRAQAEGQRRFISDAAHQLRTPLAALQAQVEAWAQAARRIAPPGGPGTMLLPVEQIEKLRGATRRTTQLANQLLALSRADAGAMGAQPLQPVDLKALCETTLEIQLDAATRHAIDLGLDVQPVTLDAHAWLLRELLANLVDNAIRYTPRGGTVTIRCAPCAGGALLEVEDDGPGVPPAERARVLERFYRVQGTQGEGTGLGLAIAEEIARVHGSHLELDSGQGGRGLKVGLRLRGERVLGGMAASALLQAV
ncbi:ATP-binding protein [Ramlibacter sp. AN1015]|uniref:sensor histidine kinase n=1 Tax=Ramlibacter sp. AN1015 TaxID=3133428 RepID=UPI0030BCE8CE